MSSATWNIIGVGFTAAGAFAGFIGTLMIANGYYPTTIGAFLISLPELLLNVITGKRRRFEIAVGVGTEDRALTLKGVVVMFVGFLLQLIGAVAALVGTLPDAPTNT